MEDGEGAATGRRGQGRCLLYGVRRRCRRASTTEGGSGSEEGSGIAAVKVAKMRVPRRRGRGGTGAMRTYLLEEEVGWWPANGGDNG